MRDMLVRVGAVEADRKRELGQMFDQVTGKMEEMRRQFHTDKSTLQEQFDYIYDKYKAKKAEFETVEKSHQIELEK